MLTETTSVSSSATRSLKPVAMPANVVAVLSVVCPNAEEADRVLGQLKLTVRKVYSSPPSRWRSGGFIRADQS